MPIDHALGLGSIVLRLSQESETSLKSYEEGIKHMEMVKDHAGASGDISGMYGAIRLESGLDFENYNERFIRPGETSSYDSD